MASYKSYLKMFQYGFYLMIYIILKSIQMLYWRLNGVQNHLFRCKGGDNYEMSAQFLKVWGRCKPTTFTIHYRRHFLSTHIAFVHPEMALQSHVSLMTVTDKEAIFCITSSDVDLYDTRKHPFFFNSQHSYAKFLLIMPISSFTRLAETVGDPKQKVIWLHHQSRSGSTATSQVLNALPGISMISEPICFFSLDQTFKYKYFEKLDYNWSY